MTATPLTPHHVLPAVGHFTAMRPTTEARAATTRLALLIGIVSMSLAAAQQPANDDFAAAAPLAGEHGSVAATTVAATAEPNEPDHAENQAQASLWWQWTAPFSGPVAFDTIEGGFDTVLAVYTGEALDSLDRVAENDDAGYSYQSLATFTANAGTTYRIAVDCFPGERGPISLRWTRLIDNNAFADAIALTGLRGSTVGDSSTADREAGEPFHAEIDPGASVWWQWTAPKDGPIVFDTFGSRFTTSLAIYTGTGLQSLELVASQADYDIQGRCRITVGATAGTTYHIAVDGVVWEEGLAPTSGEVVLRWEPSLPNDNFNDALTLTGLNGTTTGTNSGATTQPGEPEEIDGSLGGASLWWIWTPTEDGVVTFDTLGSRFDTLLGAFVGDELDQLVLVDDNDDADDDVTSRISFPATAGTTYRITVQGYEGEFGAFSLNWSWTSVPKEEPPRLSAPSRLPDGSFRLLLSGAPGQTGLLQWSDDPVRTWTDWQPFTLTDQPFEIVDPHDADRRERFYRVKP